MASQRATSVPRAGFPGGDPSLEMIPPLEQARTDYVFLTPDKYAFDFVSIVAPFGAVVVLDSQTVSEETCLLAPADGLTAEQRGTPNPPYVVYTCQLSFPTINDGVDPPIIDPGDQNDGVHRVSSNAPVFVSVVGWDAFVSYAYAAGSDLREIAPPQ
jgi:IgGFc binding protein